MGAAHRFVAEVIEVDGVGEAGRPVVTTVFTPGPDGRAVPAHHPHCLPDLVAAGLDPALLDQPHLDPVRAVREGRPMTAGQVAGRCGGPRRRRRSGDRHRRRLLGGRAERPSGRSGTGTAARPARARADWTWATLRWPAAAAVAALVWGVTGWPALGLGAAVAAVGLPAVGGAGPRAVAQIERVEAVEEWTRRVADVLAIGVGLEQAVQAAARTAPGPIAPEVAALARGSPRGRRRRPRCAGSPTTSTTRPPTSSWPP